MFKQYKRKAIAEMQEWNPVGAPTHQDELIYLIELGVSVSQADISNGSPRSGDMIARNPKDHSDMWLVAKQYVVDNFELVL